VALFLENGIDFFALWLGLSKLGVISAWINSNLKLETLAHSLNISKCTAIVTSQTLLPGWKTAVVFPSENLFFGQKFCFTQKNSKKLE
jgi:acyl-CoA synthetase (AMP-forming)/AMP-acid ligase II